MTNKRNKWSKKDIKTLTQQLSSWWVFNSLYLKAGVSIAVVWDTMPITVRTGTVIDGLRQLQAMLVERASKDHALVIHYAGVWTDNGAARDPDGSMHKQFAELAEAADKSAAAYQKLIDRIEVGGLPPEVVAWRPK